MVPRTATKAPSRARKGRKAPARRAPSSRATPSARTTSSTRAASSARASAAKRSSSRARRPAAKARGNAGRTTAANVDESADPTGKAEGKLPVQAYITSLPVWKRDVARRFDAIVDREVRNVRKAIKWRAAFYGAPGMGWFASVKAFNRHVKVTFFRGTSLKPVPPSGTHKDGRSLDVREGEAFDEDRMVRWVRQAAALPGWGS